MDCPLHLSAGKAAALLCFGVVRTMHNRYIPVPVLFKAFTLHKIRAHKADLIARKKTEILLGRFLHKVIAFNIKLPAKRNLSCAKRLILKVVGHLKILHLVLRVIVNHKLNRVKHCHHSRLFQLQILPDTVLQHRIIRRRVCLAYAAKLNKALNGLRRESAPS